MGYAAAAAAYRDAAAKITATALSQHYRTGLEFFHDEFVHHLKSRLWSLSGGAWALADYVAYACGSDVDFMTHIVDAANDGPGSAVYPGDWYGFAAGALHPGRVDRAARPGRRLACLCVPSVRNGHLTHEMLRFLGEAECCLLNINLFPTLEAAERHAIGKALASVLEKSIISVSFSRGFGLTASQLGVILIHRDHPWRKLHHERWSWLTYFYNAIAAHAFMGLDVDEIAAVDTVRRKSVSECLKALGLPVVHSGSYYVKSFRPEGEVAPHLRPLSREGLVRLCFKPEEA